VPRKRRPHDEPGYRQRRRLLMKSVTPATRCGRCGKLLHEHPPHKSGRPARWQVGHVLDAADHGNLGPLRIEASVCNVGAGARLGHHRAFGQYRDNGGRTGEGHGPREVGPHHPMHYRWDPTSIAAAPCVKATGVLCATCAEWRAHNSKQKG
jgi:hypothetical protein